MFKIEPFVSSRVRELSEKAIRRASGTLLLSDISGFTAISEALGKKGKEGIEELSYLLNNYFKGMLGIAKKHGGEVVKLCGDSLMIAFYHGRSVDIAEACAREMMKETEKFKNVKTCAGSFDVSMKVVGKSGEWNEFILGDERRREHFLCGKVVRDLMAAEDRAASGEILVGEQCAISNEQLATNKQKTDQDIRLQTTNYELRTMNSKEESGRAEQRLKSFLPKGVADLIDRESPGEHRAASTVFLNFYGYDEENPEIESIQELFNEVISVTERYGGVIHDVDSYSRGSNVMILFGAPISHENDAERAVMASMELSKLSIKPLKVRVGVCTGFVYAGIVGSDWRKEYAVIGDAVNTAARLMETAKNEETVISGTTSSLTLDKIEYKKLRSIKAKGKEQLLKRYAPLGIEEEKHFRFGFVGREEEIGGIVKAVGEGGKAIIIKGGAGIGKSRLLHEIRKKIEPTHKVLFGYTDQLKGSLHFFTSMIAREAGIRTDDPENVRKEKLEKHIREIEIGRGNNEQLAMSNGQWASQNLLRGKGEEKQIESGELYKRIPFLGAMLFDILYPNSLYESVGMSLRFENLCDAIRYYIEYQSTVNSPQSTVDSPQTKDEKRRGGEEQNPNAKARMSSEAPMTNDRMARKDTTTNSPPAPDQQGGRAGELQTQNLRVVVILDDFQWLRKDAVRVIEYITRTLLTLSTERDQITFVFSGRPEPDALDKLPLSEEIETVEFDLFALPKESTAVLSSKILKNKPLPQDVAEIVFKRTEGNPFYLEQFLLDLMEKGLIRESEDKWVKTIKFKEEEMPENVFSTVISRVDRLEEKAKEALRIASVVGIEFDEKIVGDVLKELNISHYLAQTEKESLTYKKVVGEIEHIFRHAMIKDVIYDSILRKQRREFHRLVGQGIEKLHKKEIERFYEVLAHHFGEAKEWEKALDYNLKAAQQAAKNYHNEAAIEYFLKAAEIGEEQSAGTDLRACLYEAYKGLGDIYTSISSYMLSRGYYQNAIATAGTSDKEKLVDILNGIMATHAREGNYDEALRIGEEACGISREIGYRNGTSESLCNMGGIRWFQGMSEKALKCHTEALTISREIGDEKGVAKCLDYMGILCSQQGEYQKALGYFTEALGIRKKIGDRKGIAASLNNMGAVVDRYGQYGEGRKHYRQSLKIFREIGDKQGISLELNNIGIVHSNRGEYKESLRYFAQALNIGREIGNRNGIAMTLESIAYVHFDLGLFDHVIDVANEAMSILEEIGTEGQMRSSIARLFASVYTESGSLKKAREWIGKAETVDKEAKVTESAAPFRIGMSRIYKKEGTTAALSKAKKHAEQALRISREAKHTSNEAEACLLLCEIWGALKQKKTKEHRLEACATEAYATKADSKKMEAYATEALAIARKTRSIPFLWKSYYHLYKATGDEKYLKKTKEYLTKQFEHIPAKHLNHFKRYVTSETGITLP